LINKSSHYFEHFAVGFTHQLAENWFTSLQGPLVNLLKAFRKTLDCFYQWVAGKV